MTVAQYKVIAMGGDMVETNVDGNNITSYPVRGEVVELDILGFVLMLENNQKWFCEWQARPTVSEQRYVTVLEAKPAKVTIPEAVAKPVKPVAKVRQKISIRLLRNENMVAVKVPAEIENFYKSISNGEITQSTSWFKEDGTPVSFYKLSDEMRVSEKRISDRTFSDFGSQLVNGDAINTALLRIVGVSKGRGIKVKSKSFAYVSTMDFDFFLKKFGVFVKLLWENYISTKEIKAVISYEL